MVAKFKNNQKESRQTVVFSVILGVLIFTIVGFLIVSNWRINQKRTELNARLENLQEELRVLEEQRESLQAQISQSSEEDYLEQEARERFNLKKPGEEVVTILPSGEEEVKQEESFWQKIWNKIKF